MRHHAQLLEVLFAENREIRSTLRKQLADDGADAGEEIRPKPVFQTHLGWTFRQDFSGKAVRVHGLDVRIPNQVDILGCEQGEIGIPGPRVRTKILRRRELGWIDEDRDDHFRRAALRQPAAAAEEESPWARAGRLSALRRSR